MRSGGEADKLANAYEGRWTTRQLFDVLDGKALSIEIEPLVDGQGVEFIKVLPAGASEHHSVKIQTPKNGWTMAELMKPHKDTKRTFLGDLLRKTASDPRAVGVFVSQVSANALRIMSDDARLSADLKSFQLRLAGSAKQSADFHDHVLPTCGGDEARAFGELKRIRVDTVTDDYLLREVERDVPRSFYRPDGAPLDVPATRRLLAEFILESIGKKIDRHAILDRLAKEGIREAAWARDATILDQVARCNQTYSAHVTQQLINRSQIPRRESGEAFDFLTAKTSEKFGGFIGVAGLGKSCTTAELLERLRAAGVVFIVIRLDVQTTAMTARVFGQQMGLPTSPVDVIAGIAEGGPCALIIDQLDALSFASGRNQNLWAVFEDLLFEVQKYPNMRVWFVCREFDLENDHRLRELVAREKAKCVRLALLDTETVKNEIKKAGVDPTLLGPKQLELLRTPMHLSLYLEANPAGKPLFDSVKDLYDRYWDHKQDYIKERLGRSVDWTRVIDLLCDELSRQQTLSAPAQLIEDTAREDAHAMASANVLVKENETYRFFHEGFFDYAFARRFVIRGHKILDLLLHGGEQHLFRRAQVRQVLAYLRSYNWELYLTELDELLNEPRVRVHIKKLVLDWMRTLPDPKPEEAEILNLNGC